MLRFLDGDNRVRSLAKDMHVRMWVNKCLQGLQSVHILSPSHLHNGRVPTQYLALRECGSVRAQSEGYKRPLQHISGWSQTRIKWKD